MLAEHLLAVFPQLEGVTFTHRWAGVIDRTSRFTPVFAVWATRASLAGEDRTCRRNVWLRALDRLGVGVGS